MQIGTSANDGRTAEQENAPAQVVSPSRKLIDGRKAAQKSGCSYRHWLRLCDSGCAPWGMKLGALRRWDEAELDAWIASGCKPVQKGGAQ